MAALIGLDGRLGAELGVLSLLGDALSSALKRRLRLAPGLEVPLLDQLPEAVVPLIALRAPLSLDWSGVAAVSAVFTLLDLASARARHSLLAPASPRFDPRRCRPGRDPDGSGTGRG